MCFLLHMADSAFCNPGKLKNAQLNNVQAYRPSHIYGNFWFFFVLGMPSFGAACILLRKLSNRQHELSGGLRYIRVTDGG